MQLWTKETVVLNLQMLLAAIRVVADRVVLIKGRTSSRRELPKQSNDDDSPAHPAGTLTSAHNGLHAYNPMDRFSMHFRNSECQTGFRHVPCQDGSATTTSGQC